MSAPSPSSAPILVAVDASPEFAPRNTPNNDSAGGYVDEVAHARLVATERVHLALETAVDFGSLAYDHIVALGPIERVLSDYSHDASLAVIGTRSQGNWIQRLFQKSATNRLTGSLACPVVSVGLDAVHQQMVVSQLQRP